MLDFLGTYIFAIIYGISAIFGIINFDKYRNKKGKILTSFLIITATTEFLAAYFSISYREISSMAYFIYIPLNYFLWFYFFSQLLSNQKIVKILLVVFIFFYVYDLIEIIINKKDYDATNLKTSYYCGAISLLLLSMQYFRELLNSNLIIHNHRILYFWTTLGLVIIWIVYIPIMVVVNHQVFKDSYIFFKSLTIFINVLGNLCFIIGILWSQKKYNN
jgi:hypothetical protein